MTAAGAAGVGVGVGVAVLLALMSLLLLLLLMSLLLLLLLLLLWVTKASFGTLNTELFRASQNDPPACEFALPEVPFGLEDTQTHSHSTVHGKTSTCTRQ